MNSIHTLSLLLFMIWLQIPNVNCGFNVHILVVAQEIQPVDRDVSDGVGIHRVSVFPPLRSSLLRFFFRTLDSTSSG